MVLIYYQYSSHPMWLDTPPLRFTVGWMPDLKKVHEPPLGLSQPWLTCSHVRVMHTEPRSNCAHSVLAGAAFALGVSSKVFWITTSFAFCIHQCVCLSPSFTFGSHLCHFATLHFTALILALAMALDDETGTVPDSQPLLGLLRPVCCDSAR